MDLCHDLTRAGADPRQVGSGGEGGSGGFESGETRFNMV